MEIRNLPLIFILHSENVYIKTYGIPLNTFSPAVREYPSCTSPKIQIHIDFSYMMCLAEKQTIQREQTRRKKR